VVPGFKQKMQRLEMGAMAGRADDQYSEKEAAARRDATIKRMIAMPPKPHSEMKVGKKKKMAAKKTRAAKSK
jgi:hypothetical protein